MEIEDYIREDGYFAENDKYLLRRLSEADKDPFMQLQIDISDMPFAYEEPGFYNLMWSDYLNGEDLVLCIIEKKGEKFIGMLMLKKLHEEIQEIGLNIVREYRNQGIGYEAAYLMLKHAKECSGADKYHARIYSDNLASTAMIKKFHPKKVGQEDSEFIKAMKVTENAFGEDFMSKVREENKDVFDQAEQKGIIVYEIQI